MPMSSRQSERVEALRSRFQLAIGHTYCPASQAFLKGLAEALYLPGSLKALNEPKREFHEF